MRAVPSAEGCWIVRLDRGEEVVETLTGFVRDHDLPSGEVRGIGALRDVELGYFDADAKRYDRTTFPGSMELLSFLGNIAWADDGPVLHAHAVLAGPDLVARGGHLFRGVVSVTGEFTVTARPRRVRRAVDSEFGLKLIRFEGEE